MNNDVGVGHVAFNRFGLPADRVEIGLVPAQVSASSAITFVPGGVATVCAGRG